MPLKFAVVREDPRIELQCAERSTVRRALLCASGGDTALAFAQLRPDVALTLYDFNPEQLAHVRAKARAVQRGDLAALNVGDADPAGLCQRGEFEALFRVLRTAILELVAPEPQVERYFDPATPVAEAHALARDWAASPYWPAVYAVAFNDPLLVAMFGPDAVQHARPGSYPGYFQGVFTRGLLDAAGPRNPFLQHVLLQRYLHADVPPHLRSGVELDCEMVLGGVPDVPDLGRFDLVHLSNIFDWAPDAVAACWIEALRALRPGTVLTIRQLNNDKDRRPLLEPHFTLDEGLASGLLAQDRSLFYDRLLVAVRT